MKKCQTFDKSNNIINLYSHSENSRPFFADNNRKKLLSYRSIFFLFFSAEIFGPIKSDGVDIMSITRNRVNIRAKT